MRLDVRYGNLRTRVQDAPAAGAEGPRTERAPPRDRRFLTQRPRIQQVERYGTRAAARNSGARGWVLRGRSGSETSLVATARPLSIGRLARFPLADLMVFLLDRRATGTLVLQERTGRKSAFYFYLGAVAKAQSPAVLAASHSDTELVNQQLEWAAALGGSTAYGFYENVDYLHRVRPAAANPLAQIWRCAKRSVDPERVSAVISELGDQTLSLHLRADLGRFNFSWEEVAAIEQLRAGRLPFNDLLAQHEGDPATLCKIVYVLAICRHIRSQAGGEPIGVDGPRDILFTRTGSAVPLIRSSRPAQARHRSFLSAPRATSGLKRQGRSQANAIPVPGGSSTPPPASTSAVNARVSSQSASAHSETLCELADDPYCGAGQALVSQSRPDSWARAEALAQAGHYDRALQLVRELYRPRWNNADEGAFVAYLEARCRVLQSDEGMELAERCSQASKDHPGEPKFIYYRAWVYKALGWQNAALMDFAEVVRSDPMNIDAARELHLAQKRRRGSSNPSGLMERIVRSLAPTAGSRPEGGLSSRPTARVRKQ